MEDTLKELCREARDRQNITIQDLADETGISISTIGNFLLPNPRRPTSIMLAPSAPFSACPWTGISAS